MVEWTVADAEALSAYLRSSKNKLLELLRTGAPSQTGDRFEEVALNAKENLGWMNCIKTIEKNAIPQRPRQESSEHQDVTIGL